MYPGIVGEIELITDQSISLSRFFLSICGTISVISEAANLNEMEKNRKVYFALKKKQVFDFFSLCFIILVVKKALLTKITEYDSSFLAYYMPYK
jgi:hypothetical protein